jgi:hypothetical protein
MNLLAAIQFEKAGFAVFADILDADEVCEMSRQLAGNFAPGSQHPGSGSHRKRALFGLGRFFCMRLKRCV